MRLLFPVLALVAFAPVPTAADVVVADHACVEQADDLPKETLDKVRNLDVLFGHQSVGGNVLEGLAALAEGDERWSIERAEDPDAEWFGANDGLGDFYVGENEDPMRKIADFQERMLGGVGGAVDVAMFKFCYVDLPEEGSQPKKVFEAARKAVETVEKKYPKLIVVWWTCPLETGGNRARNEYNRLVRSYCTENKKALYDIADLESDGKGDALREDYTEDGGHLGEDGRARAAKAFWWLLARLAEQPGND